jgi:hypothetical protein
MAVLWTVAPYSVVDIGLRFTDVHCVRCQGNEIMEAVGTSGMSVNFYGTARRDISADSYLHLKFVTIRIWNLTYSIIYLSFSSFSCKSKPSAKKLSVFQHLYATTKLITVFIHYSVYENKISRKRLFFVSQITDSLFIYDVVSTAEGL